MQRTQEEIRARLEETLENDHDIFGFEREHYAAALNYENAKPYLKDNVTADEWQPLTHEEVVEKAREYMEFAKGKARNKRRLSAMRSLSHYRAWLWLMGEDQFDDIIHDAKGYGEGTLARIEAFLEDQ